VLAQHCADLGRPYEAIEKTLSTRLASRESSDEFVRRCTEAAGLGIEHMAVITARPWTAEALATLATAIAKLREVQPPQMTAGRPDRDQPLATTHPGPPAAAAPVSPA
jgi:hypothetical protein